ncbi:hypothetical protein LINPERPRIM_LOCUS13113 [Linum perenne]
MILVHEYPLSIVDHIGFRRYSFSLQPLFQVPSRNQLSAHVGGCWTLIGVNFTIPQSNVYTKLGQR